MGIEDRKKPMPCQVCHAPIDAERKIIRQLVVTVDFRKRIETETMIICQCGNIKFSCIEPMPDSSEVESER